MIELQVLVVISILALVIVCVLIWLCMFILRTLDAWQARDLPRDIELPPLISLNDNDRTVRTRRQ